MTLLLVLALQQDVDQLLRDLGSDDVAVRDRGTKALIGMGRPIASRIHKELEQADDGEMRSRLRAILREVDPWFESKKLCSIPSGATVVDCRVGPDEFHIAWKQICAKGEFVAIDSNRGEMFDRVKYLEMSLDGRSVVYSAEKDGKSYIVFNGQRKGPFDGIWSVPRLSPDGTRTVSGIRDSGRKFYIVDDKRIGDDLEDVSSTFAFDPQGKHWAFFARADKHFVLITDDNRTEAIKYFKEFNSIVYSPDGERLVYIEYDDGKYRVVADGKKSEPFVDVGRIVFNRDGSRLAYCANVGPGNGKEEAKWTLFVNGERKSQEFLKMDTYVPPFFLPDGTSIGCSAGGLKAGRYQGFLVIGERTIPLAYGCFVDSVAYSPDGKTLAYGAFQMVGDRGARKFAMVVGEDVGEEFDSVGVPVFSPDGKTVAYRARDERTLKSFVVVGKAKSESFGHVGDPIFNSDGQKVMFKAWKGEDVWRIVMDFK